MRPLFATKHIPILALVKHMTDAGSTPVEIQAASSRAKRVNAGHSPVVRLASVAGSTPAQVATALAAARAAARKVTVVTTTVTEDDDELEEDDDTVVDDGEGEDEDVGDPPTPPAGMSSRELRGYWAAYVAGARGPSHDDRRKAEEKIWSNQGFTAKDFPKLRSKMTRALGATSAAPEAREGIDAVDQHAAQEKIWSAQGFTAKDFPNLRSKMTKALRAPRGSAPYVKGPDADRRDIIRAARQGVDLSSDHVKMLRKMGLDDAGIAAVAAKMAKTS